MKKEVGSKYFDRIIIVIFVLVFLFSYSFKLGGFYHEIVTHLSFFSMLLAPFHFFGAMFFPIAQVFYSFFYHSFSFLPVAFTTLFDLVVLGSLGYLISRKKEELRFDGNLVLVIFLAFMAVITTLINGLPFGFGNFEFTHWMEAPIILICLSVMLSSNKRLRVFNWVLILAAASLAFRLYNHTFTYDMAILGFENNDLARQFSFFLFFLLGVFWAERNKILRALILISAAFMAQGITQLGSRATMVSVIIGAVAFGIFNIRKKTTWVYGALAIILVIFFTPPMIVEDFKSLFESDLSKESEEGSISGRFQILEYGWETFKDRPIRGYGVYPDRFNDIMDARYDTERSAHNSFIITAIHMGFFGLLTYVLLFLNSIWLCYRAMRNSKGKNDMVYYTANGTLFGLIAIMANQFMLNQPWIAVVFIGFGVSCGVYHISRRELREENSEEESEEEVSQSK